MSALIVRDATAADRPTIRDLTLAAYAQYAARMPNWELYRERMIALVTTDSAAIQLVAVVDDQIIGAVLLYPGGVNVYGPERPIDWPELRMLAVNPAARGHGAGAALLEACIARARQWGATSIGLHTEDFMAAALRLYLRRGFVRVPEVDFYPLPDVHVKGYRLALDDEPAPAADPTA